MSRTVQITGMTCAACEDTVSDAFRELPGVAGVTASARRQEAVLTGDNLPTDAQILAAMNGHLCRCGAYPSILRAIRKAAGA